MKCLRGWRAISGGVDTGRLATVWCSAPLPRGSHLLQNHPLPHPVTGRSIVGLHIRPHGPTGPRKPHGFSYGSPTSSGAVASPTGLILLAD